MKLNTPLNRLCIRALLTSAAIMATCYGIGTHNVCIGVIGFIVVVAGIFALNEDSKTGQ